MKNIGGKKSEKGGKRKSNRGKKMLSGQQKKRETQNREKIKNVKGKQEIKDDFKKRKRDFCTLNEKKDQ